MIRNYINTAIRNLLRHRFFSIINIFGLSMAMSVCMGIIMLVADQLQYDAYNTKKDRIFRVNSIHVTEKLVADEGPIMSSTSPMPVREELEKYSAVEKVVRFKRGFGNGWIEFENQDVNIPLGGYFADPEALDMFEFELQYGDRETALRDPYSVVITRKAADKLFSEDWTTLHHFLVDESYLDNLEIPLVAGKFFSAEAGESNKNFIVLNEAAAKKFNFDSPVDALGTEISFVMDSTVMTVIGVVKDYNHESLMDQVKPMALLYRPDRWQTLQVRYSGTYDDAMKTAGEAWAKMNPGLKMDVKDMRGEVLLLYNTLFGDAVQIFGFIAFLAIVISCLGLLGMATYATETRMKEVSVRKVLGSSDGALVYLLSKGFLMIILIAIAIGVPAAYFLNMLWLELLPYHVLIDLPAIAFGVGMLIVFAVITIGSQTYRATFVNPVDNLKSE